jgi:hypothetical protein
MLNIKKFSLIVAITNRNIVSPLCKFKDFAVSLCVIKYVIHVSISQCLVSDMKERKKARDVFIKKNAKTCIFSILHDKIVLLICSKVASAAKIIQLHRHY